MVEYREARASDAEAIANLHARSWRESYRGSFRDEFLDGDLPGERLRVWRERLGGMYTASPVAGDGKIYMMSETGETLVLRAGRSPEVISRSSIDGRILATPAIAAGQLFIRTDDRQIAIGSPQGS